MNSALAILVVLGVVMLGLIGALIKYGIDHVRWVVATWQYAARKLGLEYSRRKGIYRIEGTRDDLRIAVRQGSGGAQPTAEFFVRHGRLPKELAFAKQPQFNAPPEHTIGDPGFDRAVLVAGHRHYALALLDYESRRLVRAMVERNIKVEDGWFQHASHTQLNGPDDLIQRTEAVMWFAERIGLEAREIDERLVRNATQDPMDTVREANMLAVYERLWGSDAARSLARAAANARDPSVRVAGLVHLPEIPVAAVFDALRQPMTPSRRRWAVRAAARRLSQPDHLELCRQLLASDLRLAIAALGEQLNEPAWKMFAGAMSRLGAEAQAGVVDAAPKKQNAEVERTIRAVLVEGDAVARIGAAAWLGVYGTLESVEQLHDIAERTLMSPKVKEAAREAIARIQARLADGEAGGLSVMAAAESAGGLSELHEQGALTLEEPHIARVRAVAEAVSPAEAEVDEWVEETA